MSPEVKRQIIDSLNPVSTHLDKINVRFEQYLAVRIKPRPRWCPRFLWRRMLALMIYVEMMPPKFSIEKGGVLP